MGKRRKSIPPGLICCLLYSSIRNWPPLAGLLSHSIALDRRGIVNNSDDCTLHLWRTPEPVQTIGTLLCRLYSSPVQCHRIRERTHHSQTVTLGPISVWALKLLLDCCTSCQARARVHNRKRYCAPLQRQSNLHWVNIKHIDHNITTRSIFIKLTGQMIRFFNSVHFTPIRTMFVVIFWCIHIRIHAPSLQPGQMKWDRLFQNDTMANPLLGPNLNLTCGRDLCAVRWSMVGHRNPQSRHKSTFFPVSINCLGWNFVRHLMSYRNEL